MEDLWDDMENDDFEEIIDVILGIREDVKMYSRSVVRYLYQFLQKHKEVKYSDLLEVIGEKEGCQNKIAIVLF